MQSAVPVADLMTKLTFLSRVSVTQPASSQSRVKFSRDITWDLVPGWPSVATEIFYIWNSIRDENVTANIMINIINLLKDSDQIK